MLWSLYICLPVPPCTQSRGNRIVKICFLFLLPLSGASNQFNDIVTELISSDTDKLFMMNTVFLILASHVPRN